MFARVAASLVLVAAASTVSAQSIEVSKANKTIAITSTDSAETEADTADVFIGFTAYGATQEGTYAAASQTSNAIVNALTAAGLKRLQIRSDQQQLTGISSDNPQDKARFDKGLRFFFSQGWTVIVPAAQAADVLHSAITAGANNSGNIRWRVADDDALEAQAAAKALAHAQQIAERMAGGLHAHLGPPHLRQQSAAAAWRSRGRPTRNAV